MLFFMMDLHADSGVIVNVGVHDGDAEVGILLILPSWPGIDSWLSLMAL